MCAAKGFDGVEVDNIDDMPMTRFPLTADEPPTTGFAAAAMNAVCRSG